MADLSEGRNCTIFRTSEKEISHFAKVYEYPCGIVDIVASDRAVFREAGWEASASGGGAYVSTSKKKARKSSDPQAEDLERSMRRARSKLRRLALANDFKYFVTLTLDPQKVDAHDGADVVKKLNAWASNAVQRHGLRYILVPERHKSGAIHFHGFFNDALPLVDSGTIKPPMGGKPRKPRSKAQREDWLASGGQICFNLPTWSMGFSTAFELYGEYPAAVSYVTKYIGKDGEKPAGRWYYSGGALEEPSVALMDIGCNDLEKEYSGKAFCLNTPAGKFVVVNGLRKE